jgi:cell division protein FtsL
MSTEQAGISKPSKVAITKLLAEAEVARRRSLRPWLLAFLLPLLAGAALIGVSSHEVYVRLEKLKQLNQQIAANEGRIEEQKKELEALNAQLQETKALASAALAKLPQAEAKEVIAATTASNPVAAATTPHVFIQIHDEEQRKKAADVAQALKNSGFIVPGIEHRPEKVDSDQVKYFRQEDKDAAVKVSTVLAGQGVADAKALLASGKAPPGQIEVWFAPAVPKPTPTPADAVMTNIQNRVRKVIAKKTAKSEGAVTSDSTLASLGVVSASYMEYVREGIMREFSLGSDFPTLAPENTVGYIAGLVYERTGKKGK